MKILFICGSLEPGKDGVGDYTRKLAAELQKQDIGVSVIAFNDRFVEENMVEHTQTDENEVIQVTRFSPGASIKLKREYIEQLIQKSGFDWISLQYVPYGFNKKGVPFYLPKSLEQLSTKINWHIMFHETWIGMSVLSPFMHRVYGYFQQHIIAALIKKLKPKVITTTNRYTSLPWKKRN